MAAQETWWHVALIEIDGRDTVILHVEPTRSAIGCPTCGSGSSRRHSSYRRRPLDLPWRGATVRLVVHARRFFCDVPTCPRKIFAERFDGLLACYAQRTASVTALLIEFGLRAGGEGGARLARKAGIPTSPDTLLRLVRGREMFQNPDSSFSLALWKQEVARYVGIDFSSYVADGTLIGHSLIDEPEDPTNWGGQAVPFAEHT